MFTDISNEYLDKLGPQEAVALIEDILHADAQMSSIRPTQISIPHNINAPDGGIDAKTTNVKKESALGSMKAGTTYYQIKSGKFAPTKTNIHNILFNKKTLKKRVQECFDNHGTFILVLTGYDAPQSDEIISKIKAELYNNYKNAKIHVWTQSTLRGFLKNIPSLRLNLLGIDGKWFMTYEGWSRQDDMKNKAELGPKQLEFIKNVQQFLIEISEEHLRITADPGIGKTKLILEALKPRHLSKSCIYVDKPSEFLKSDTLQRLTNPNTQSRTVLVVDECDDYTMVEIWRQVKPHSQKLRLITIYNEHGTQMNHMRTLPVPQLDDNRITNILKSYDIDQSRLDTWCKECRPSPRAAHVIGNNLKSYPDDIFRPPDTVQVWDRYIASKERLDSDDFKTRKKILLWISIFRRIGFGDVYTTEQNILEDILKNDGIEKHVFTSTVNTLKEMRILQGDTTLYITPKILHLYLYRQWHQIYKGTIPFPLNDWLNDADNSFKYEYILKWYSEMFSYAKSVDVSHHYAKGIFARGGYVDRYGLLDSYEGAEMFYNFAKADVDGAISYLENWAKSKSKDGLLPDTTVREQVIMVLVGAAMKRELFHRSADILLVLSEAKNGLHYNSAASTFEGLFHPVSGKSAQTEVPPSERVQLIRDALASDISRVRRLGIGACNAAMVSLALPGPRIREDMWQDYTPWVPKSDTDISRYQIEVLEIMRDYMGRFAGEEMSLLCDVLLNEGIFLLYDVKAADTVLSVIHEAYKKHQINAADIINAVSRCRGKYSLFPIPDTLQKGLIKLQDMVIGSDYSSMMIWNVAESDKFEEDQHLHALMTLAEQSLDIETLGPELDWLVTDKAVYGHQFGHILGNLDDFTLLQFILDAQRRAVSSSAGFLGGYLCAVFEKNENRWEDTMDELYQDVKLRSYIPELTAASGMTDKAATRVYDVIYSYDLEPSLLESFIYTDKVGKMSEAIFQKWVCLLWNGNSESRQTCLVLYWQYYIRHKRIVPDSAHEILFSENAKAVVEGGRHYTIDHWCHIVEVYVKQHPEDANVLCHALKFVAANLMGTGAERHLAGLVLKSADQNGIKAWEQITTLLEPTDKNPASVDNENHFIIKYLMQSNRSLVDRITLTVMHDWIYEDVKKRAPLVAYLLPDTFDIAIDFMSEYGAVDMVDEMLIFNQLQCNMMHKTEHHTKKIQEIEKLKKDTADDAILTWLEKCKAALVSDKDKYENRYRSLR